MKEVASLYTTDGRLTEDDAHPLKPGDLAYEEIHQAGRVELPSGRKVRPEDLDLIKESSTLDEARRQRLVKEKREQRKRETVKTRRPRLIKKSTRARSKPELWKHAHTPGSHVGYLYTSGDHVPTLKLYTAGPVQVGSESFVVCVAPGRRLIYLGRNGAILLLSKPESARVGNPMLRAPVTDPELMTQGEKELWGDAICRQVLDLYTSRSVDEAVATMAHRYGMVLKAYIDGAIVDCAAVGVQRSAIDFIQAADRTYTEREGTPVRPGLKHAIYMSLALCLDPDAATQLIEYAGYMEMKMSIFQREVAYAIYVEARRQLSILCPQWLIHQKCTDWRQLDTGIAQLLQLQFFRTANDAITRGMSLEATAGMRLAMTQLGEQPLAGSYINRTLDPEIGTECLNVLRKITPEEVIKGNWTAEPGALATPDPEKAALGPEDFGLRTEGSG